MPRLLTQAQFARKLKRDRSTINKWIRRGVIKTSGDGRIDPVQAEKDLAANVVPKCVDSTKSKRKHRKKAVPSDSTTGGNLLNCEPTLTEARRQTELLKAELLGLKLAVEKGDLVPREAPVAWLCSVVAIAKAHFWGLPNRMAETLAVMSEPKEIVEVLRKEIRRILEDLASSLGKEEAEQLFLKIDKVVLVEEDENEEKRS